MEPITVKDPTTYEEQLNKLMVRGCSIDDPDFCTNVLSRVSYYRLSAYFLPYKRKDNSYHSNISFEKIFRIYEFDRAVRDLVSSAVEEAEVNLRAKLSYHHAHKYGSLGYLDENTFSARHVHPEFIDRVTSAIRSNSTTPIVRHHMEKYGGLFPLWVIIELFTFGMLSYFFADLKKSDQNVLSQLISGSTSLNALSWLRCCTDLRNMCAHYGRLYYRIFPAIPASLPPALKASERRLFGAIWALRHLYPDSNKWRQEVIYPLSLLITEYETDIDLQHIGFPEEWESLLR